MEEKKIENHFEAGAIVNNGQMNVGGGTINVYKNGTPEQGEARDVARLITDYLAPADKYLKEGWKDRMYDFWKAVVGAGTAIFAKPKNKGDKDFNKMYVFYVVGYIMDQGIYENISSKMFPEVVGETLPKYDQYIRKKLDYVGDLKLQKSLTGAIDKMIKGK